MVRASSPPVPGSAGTVLARRKLDDGLVLEQVRCPLGVLAVVFESRPDALVQIASLALRSGNAVLLKGGREAAESNRALAERGARARWSRRALPPDAVQLLDDRSEVEALLGLEKGVDLVVARGGKEFVEHVRARSRIPVLAHAEGVCHVFLHRSADPLEGGAHRRRQQGHLSGGVQRAGDAALGARGGVGARRERCRAPVGRGRAPGRRGDAAPVTPR